MASSPNEGNEKGEGNQCEHDEKRYGTESDQGLKLTGHPPSDSTQQQAKTHNQRKDRRRLMTLGRI
jgi:hypothetical protein